jgi:hypothetical protein
MENTPFIVRSDHEPLRWLFSVAVSDANPRLVRWRLALAAYVFEVQLKPGPSQKVADALSRLPSDGLTMNKPELSEEEIPTLALDVYPPGPPFTPRSVPMVQISERIPAVASEEVMNAQKEDRWCSEFRARVSRGSRSVEAVYVGKNNLLCLASFDEGLEPRVVVPERLRERLLTLYHYRRFRDILEYRE